MSKLLACPDPRELQRLALGQLSDPEADQLGEHILACDSCADRLNTLSAADPLVASLHGSSPLWADNETADALMDRLIQSPPDSALAETPTVSATEGAGLTTPGEPMPSRVGRYQILGPLGTGGMGAVYRAHDPQLHRDVAVKVPFFRGSEEARVAASQRFLREARAAAAVRHANICPIYDVGEEKGRPFVVMALVEGESLADRLRRQRRFEDPQEAVSLVAQIADALAAVHALQIVHRDLKPGNILLDRSSQPFLTDFGLARGDDSDTITSVGQLVGTPAYMAPEQAAPELGPIGPWSDQYSLAVVLFQMLTGKLPFEGSSTALIFQIGSKPVPAASQFRADLDPALERVLMKALSRQARDRYGSVAEFARALRGWSAAAAAVESSPSAVTTKMVGAPEPPAPIRRSSVLVAFAIAAVLGLAALGAEVYQLYFRTSEGTLIVEVDGDADLRFQKGKLLIYDSDGKLQYTLMPSEKNKTLPPGKYLIAVAGADGLKIVSPKFEITRDGKAKVRVTIDAAAAAKKNDDPERKAAEWVLSVGGKIHLLNEQGWREVTTLKAFPGGSYDSVAVAFENNNLVTDASLDNLKGFPRLLGLGVELRHTAVTSAGLERLKAFPNLKSLEFTGHKLDDAGVAHIKAMNNLEWLVLVGVGLNDSQLAKLKTLTALKNLHMHYNDITDVGLEHLKSFTNLTGLLLQVNQITDKGLEHLQALTKLHTLMLESNPISDAGLKHLYPLANLGILNLTRTKVTAEGVAALHKALPGCKITWDGGTIPDVERKAAEWVVSVGGKVTVNNEFKKPPVTELPKGLIVLTGVHLGGNQRVTDSDLARFKDCVGLWLLELHATKVTNEGLAVIEKFRTVKNLTELYLGHTSVADAGLAHIRPCTGLRTLWLQETAVTDAGLAHVRQCTNLRILWLHQTAVTDDGLTQLREMKNLQWITLEKTKVTADGVKKLAAALPGCKITWDGGTIEPSCIDATLNHLHPKDIPQAERFAWRSNARKSPFS